MYSNRPFFGSRQRSRLVNHTVRPLIDYLLLAILLILLIKSVAVIGFAKQMISIEPSTESVYKWMVTLIAAVYLVRAFICAGFKSFQSDFFTYLSIGILILLLVTFNIDRAVSWMNGTYFYSLLVLLLFVFELSRFDIRNITLVLNPAQLFMMSFAFLIFSGAALLMLPNATTHPISFVDALFTSTSAICVTGLIVLDTATQFTGLGKSIILMLIQIGGIGIITFTSFFGFFFKGGSSSFSERFVLSDFFNDENLSEIRKTLAKVVFITLMIESLGAAFVYINLDPVYFNTIGSRLRFSVFHSVSAFCNAGFSTLTEGFYDARIRNSYSILYAMGALIIFGGIGFPILLNLYTYFKYKMVSLTAIIQSGKKKSIIPMVISVNSRLVILTTLVLIAVGMIFFLIFEHEYTLRGMDISGRVAHAFFGSVTPRTAGFNSVNMANLSIATVVMTIFLMWIGASPISTGGGIKTSTFAIAILNVWRIARIKNHIEFNRREIHERSVDRAFAIIILSIIILGCASLVVYLIEPGQSALKILFECVSAFGTVGLSLGITPSLTDASKLILVSLMYMGRMGILTLLFAFIRGAGPMVRRFPKENILIT